MKAAQLESVLEGLFNGKIEQLRRLSGGASRHTWSFDVTKDSGEARGVIIQIERPGSPVPAGHMAAEAELLVAAKSAGVPVARVVDSGNDNGIGAEWIAVDRIEGETIPRKLFRDDLYTEARSLLPRQCGRALAGIHALDVDRFPTLNDTDQLRDFAAILHALDEPRPALELALRWLRESRPPSQRRTVVHGDFRTGNLLVGPKGLEAVLDWELAHIGDPLEDLGWFCVKAWRFSMPGRAGGFGSIEELAAAYEEASKTPVDLGHVRWWEALGTLKWAIICMIQAQSHLSGASRSLELAATGRRVCESEWDLLELMGAVPRDEALSDNVDHSGDIFGRPTARELAEAVREFLVDEIMEKSDGRNQFLARVASNAVGIVERELALGPELVARQRRRLEALGVGTEAELAAAIRSNEAESSDVLLSSLADTARDQLMVANPRYLDR